MIYALLVSVAMLGLYVFQDGWMTCNDGERYTSSKPQPSPFHRRFCGWSNRSLTAASWASLLILGVLMGSWQGALLLLALPGAWFCAVHPTTVDGPAMLLAALSAHVFPSHPYAACALALGSGFIHERGPVFAALYAWHPLLLVGLLAAGWWRKAAVVDGDRLVGRASFRATVAAHRPYQDFLDARVTALGLRGLLLLPIFAGTLTVHGFTTFAVAFCSRAVATDSGRMLFWAAPALIKGLPELPNWMVALHVLTFRRCI